MTSQPRLFARTREQPHKDFKKLSSENVIIVLLDVYSDDTRLRQELRHLPNCHYFRASTINNCVDLITQNDVKDALIMLIISNRFVDFIRLQLSEIAPQLSHIYVFDQTVYDQSLSSDVRFRGTFSDVQLLVEKVFSDIEERKEPEKISEAIQYVLENNAKFFWYRFFFNVLEHLHHTDISKSEAIFQMRNFSQGKPHQLERIEKFERTYKPDMIIWWYTSEHLLYRLVNRALRSNDIDKIFSWRLYIRDLDVSLRQLSSQQKHSNKIHLYRGQVHYIEDLNKLAESLGKLVSMSPFFSTSVKRVVAEMFANVSQNMPGVCGVIYKILFDSNNTETACADVHHLSVFFDEEEYLFSIRSLFRIDRVEFIDELWQIDLTAVDENDQEFCMAINPWKITIDEQSFFSGHLQPVFTRYLNFENGPFLAFQLLIDLILRLDQNHFAWQEMMEMCRQKYADSPTDLRKIDEFEQTYQHNDAAKWYTDSSFIYRLLNNSLRVEHIDTLFKLRYYIYDLHNQLAQLQTTYIQSLSDNQSVLTLYRGQRMQVIELNKLRKNVGKLISMNSFLSTTNDVQAAIFFSGDGILNNPETEVSVLYQIFVDTSVPHSIPFAKIDYLSVYEDEDEVLFSMASVFQVNTVEQYGNIWVVDLILINKEDEVWNELTAHLNE